MSNAESILKDCTDLDDRELSKVLVGVQALLEGSDSVADHTPAASSTDRAFVWGSLVTTAKRAGVHLQPFSMITRHPKAGKLLAGADCVTHTAVWFKPTTKNEHRLVVEYLCGLVITDLKQRGIPISANVLADRLGQVGSIVDEQFPGYRESGLLPILLQHKAGKPLR